MKSSSTRYGTVAVSIHWISAVLILILLGTGFRAASLTDSTAKEALLALHVPLGIAILVLTIVRLLWWWLADRKPEAPAGDPPWQRVSAKAVHTLLYVLVIVMAASGIGMIALSGAADVLFGSSQSPLPDFSQYPPRAVHGLGAWLMILLLVLHTGAALYHHFVKQDGLLGRMWFGKAAPDGRGTDR